MRSKNNYVSKRDLFDMASRLGGLDSPEYVVITKRFDGSFMTVLAYQFGLTIQVKDGVTLVHS